MPVYVVGMLALDGFSGSSATGRPGQVPGWLVVAFTVMAVVFFAVVTRFLRRQAQGRVPAERRRLYLAIIAGVIVASLTKGALAALASGGLHTRSIWIMVPIYIVSYAAALAVAALLVSRGDRRPDAS